MNFKNIKFFIVVIIVIFTNGCFTSMGLFRGANAIGKGQYEISPRWQTNTGIQAIGLNFRYGLTNINDIEIFGVGLLAKNDSGMFIPEIGIQGAITTQLFKIDWLAFGGQGPFGSMTAVVRGHGGSCATETKAAAQRVGVGFIHSTQRQGEPATC